MSFLHFLEQVSMKHYTCILILIQFYTSSSQNRDLFIYLFFTFLWVLGKEDCFYYQMVFCTCIRFTEDEARPAAYPWCCWFSLTMLAWEIENLDHFHCGVWKQCPVGNIWRLALNICIMWRTKKGWFTFTQQQNGHDPGSQQTLAAQPSMLKLCPCGPVVKHWKE